MSLRRWPFSLERLAARRFSSLLLARFSSSSDVSCCCQHTDSTGSHHIPSQSHAPVHRPHWLSAYTTIHFNQQTTLALSAFPHLTLQCTDHTGSQRIPINQTATLALSVSPHTLQSTGHTGSQCNSSYTSSKRPHWLSV